MKKLFMMIATACAVLCSCTEGAEVLVDESSIKVEPALLEVAPEGGAYELAITSSADWRLIGNSNWAVADKSSGKSGDKVTITVDPNSSIEEAHAEFKIFSGSATQTVSVVLAGADILVPEKEGDIMISADGQLVSVKYTTNLAETSVEVPVEASWLEFQDRKDAFGKALMRFQVARSQDFLPREAEINVKAKDMVHTFKLIQAKRDTIFTPEVVDNKIVSEAVQGGSVEFLLKTNVEVTVTGAPEWLIAEEPVKVEAEEPGLTAWKYKYNFDASEKTRTGYLSFHSEKGEILHQISIKQYNKNDKVYQIKDWYLREYLMDKGYLTATYVNTEVQVLPAGKELIELVLRNGWNPLPRISEVSGLGCFPNLERVKMRFGRYITTVDLRDCKKLTYLGIRDCEYVSTIKLPATVTSFVFEGRNYWNFETNQMTITGEGLQTIDLGSEVRDDAIQWIDVTGCPNATSINTIREKYGQTAMKTVYVTAAQKAAIDAGTLELKKSSGVQIVVK